MSTPHPRRCRAANPAAGRSGHGWGSLPADTTPHRAKLSDVLMLLLFDGARERALGQYRDLLEGTGWQLERVVASPGPMSIIEASRSAPG